MLQLGRILVPVDFSPCSRSALEHAVHLAQKLGAEIEVLHVWEPPRYVIPEVTVQMPGEPQRTLMEFARSEAGKEMEGFLADFEGEGQPRVSGRLASGDPTEAIIDLAESGSYDLIAMGTHGRTGLSHLFLGSVAEKVVRRAKCPVLTIRSPEHGRSAELAHG
jgi:universal stress protein A